MESVNSIAEVELDGKFILLGVLKFWCIVCLSPHLDLCYAWNSGNEVTKGGAGKGGWGNNKDEVKEGQDEVEAEKNGDNTVEEEVVEVQEPAEPEVPTYTLDEYLAQRNATKPLGSVFSAVEERKVEDVKLKQGDYDLPNFLKLGTSKQKSNAEKNQRASKCVVCAIYTLKFYYHLWCSCL